MSWPLLVPAFPMFYSFEYSTAEQQAGMLMWPAAIFYAKNWAALMFPLLGDALKNNLLFINYYYEKTIYCFRWLA